MEGLTVNSVVYAVVAYKFFEPVILKIMGKKESRCSMMEARIRALETRAAITETQNANFGKKLDEIDKKLGSFDEKIDKLLLIKSIGGLTDG